MIGQNETGSIHGTLGEFDEFARLFSLKTIASSTVLADSVFVASGDQHTFFFVAYLGLAWKCN